MARGIDRRELKYVRLYRQGDRNDPLFRGVHDYIKQAGPKSGRRLPWTVTMALLPFDPVRPLTPSIHGAIAYVWDGHLVKRLLTITADVVSVRVPVNDMRISSVVPDYRMAGAMAAEHLAACGFTRLMFYNPSRQFDGRLIEEGFVDGAAAKGLPGGVKHHAGGPGKRWTDRHAELRNWLVSIAKPVGIATVNDAQASLLLEACHTVGVAVPQEVAVVGVDNDEMYCRTCHPELTTVELPWRKIGYRAAALLHEMMRGHRHTHGITTTIPPTGVVVRKSTEIVTGGDAVVAAAIEVFKRRLGEKVSTRDLGMEIGYGVRTIEMHFRRTLGRTPMQVLRHLRIEHANRLLRDGGLPLAEVASASGFASQASFATVFKKTTGMTPGEVRRGMVDG